MPRTLLKQQLWINAVRKQFKCKQRHSVAQHQARYSLLHVIEQHNMTPHTVRKHVLDSGSKLKTPQLFRYSLDSRQRHNICSEGYHMLITSEENLPTNFGRGTLLATTSPPRPKRTDAQSEVHCKLQSSIPCCQFNVVVKCTVITQRRHEQRHQVPERQRKRCEGPNSASGAVSLALGTTTLRRHIGHPKRASVILASGSTRTTSNHLKCLLCALWFAVRSSPHVL